MSRNQTHSGCYLIFVITAIISFCLYQACDEKFYKPERDAKKKAELISYWSEATLNYFENFECSKLKYKPENVKISKFFIIESYLDKECEINKYTLADFDTVKTLKPYLTKKIDDANVIVWLSSFGGEIEGQYNDGSNAHRLLAEIRFIDKQTKTIFKKVLVKYSGTPLNSIRKNKKDPSSNVYFGDKPIEEISKIIKNQTN